MESSFRSKTITKVIPYSIINDIKDEFERELHNLNGVYNVDSAYQKYVSNSSASLFEEDHLFKSVVIIVIYFSLLLSSYSNNLNLIIVNTTKKLDLLFACVTKVFWKKRVWVDLLLCVLLLHQHSYFFIVMKLSALAWKLLMYKIYSLDSRYNPASCI